MTEFRDVPTDERKRDADAGRALPDGSFPIDNCGDLRNAIQAIGRAKDPAKAKAHIRKRRSALGCDDVELPDSFAVEDKPRASNPEVPIDVVPEDVSEIATPDDGTETEPTHAGLAVQAADTGRVLMIQRSLDQDDEPDVRGTWEFPGGGREGDESPEEAARREFCEETGLPVPAGEVTGGWRSPDGVYQGYVFTTPVEADAFEELNPDLAAAERANPDDPERRNPDVSAWFTLDQIQNMGYALRPECYTTDWSQFAGGVNEEEAMPEEPVEVAAAIEDDPDIHDDGDGGMDTVDEYDAEYQESIEEEPEMPEDTGYIPMHGVLTVLEVPSGDRRYLKDMRMATRPLPLPHSWQETSAPGHQNSTVVGRYNRLVQVGQEVRFSGDILPIPKADDYIGTIVHFPRSGISVDADDLLMAFDDENGSQWIEGARVCGGTGVSIPAFAEAWISLGDPPEGFMDGGEDLATVAWESEEQALVASSMVSVPQEFKRGPGWVTNPEETRRLWNYWVHGEGAAKIGWGRPGDFNRCRTLVGEKIAKNSPEDMKWLNQICSRWHHDALGAWPGQAALAPTIVQPPVGFEQIKVATVADQVALVASTGLVAPHAWFSNPDFEPGDGRMAKDDYGRWGAPLTITSDGQVWGHIAKWGVCHTGFRGDCVVAPQSPTGYAYFLLGQVLTDEGMVDTGSLTIGGGHADISLDWRATLAHYDNASTVFADVSVGEDDYGIWCAGWVRPGTPPEKVVAARASKISGDWRPIGRRGRELVAALAVNSPGFPVTRTHIAAGLEGALVAAGVVNETLPEQATETSFAPPVIDYDRLAAALVDERTRAQRETAELLARAE